MASPFYHDTLFFFFLFSPIIIISTIFYIILKLVRVRVWCTCEVCQGYIESRWSLQFPNLCDWYSHLLKQSPSRTIHIHVLNNVITANPKTVEHVLKTRFDNYPKGKPFSAILGDFLGRGIFNVDGDTWRFQRNMAGQELARIPTRAFAYDVVRRVTERRLIPVMEVVSKGEGGVIDLQDVFKRFSFDCICRFSFGLDPKCLELGLVPLSEFALSFDLASRLSAERAMVASPLVWKVKRFLNVGSERKLRNSIRKVNDLAREVIRQRRRLGFAEEGDLLSNFMRSTGDETYLRDIVVNFLLAGRDTVASALTGFFWLVARHQPVAAAIINEANRVMGKGEGVGSYEQLNELHYLHGAVYESMRLFPPVQLDSKFCLNDDVLPDGRFVKGGTRVTYHPYAMGRMEEIWGFDCLEFKPERWLRDGVFCGENSFKYPVFNAGFRVCLGKEMALIELKYVAVSLLRLYRVELVQSDITTPRFSPGLTATYRDGLRVFVRDIDSRVIKHKNDMESDGGLLWSPILT